MVIYIHERIFSCFCVTQLDQQSHGGLTGESECQRNMKLWEREFDQCFQKDIEASEYNLNTLLNANKTKYKGIVHTKMKILW